MKPEMIRMDFVEMYYSNVVGYYPCETDEYRIKSQNMIDYLIDAGIPTNLITKFVEEAPASDYIIPDMLPDWLWNGSLLKRNTFYYHNTLQITSKPPVFNPRTGKETVSPFFLEMKIQYVMDELIRYFYRKLNLDIVLMDKKRDIASAKYLLDRYSRVATFIEPIDFVLALIDYTHDIDDDDERTISSILDVKNYEQEVLKMLQAKVAEATVANVNKIIWR
jgi:hypothetical protein